MTKAVYPNAQFLSVRQGAKLLGITETTLRRAIASGRVPVVKIGPRTVRIPKSYFQAKADETDAEG